MSRLSQFGHKLYTGEVSYNFIGNRRRWYIVSAILIAVSILSIGIRGLDWGIEFEGGADFQVQAAVTDTTVEEFTDAVNNAGVADLGEVDGDHGRQRPGPGADPHAWTRSTRCRRSAPPSPRRRGYRASRSRTA